MKLRPVNYEWINKDIGIKQGFIAQEVEKVKSDWVKEMIVESESPDTIKTIQMTGLEAYLVKAIQELNNTVIELKEKIQELESKK